jgi:hypothetical protein
LPFLLSLFLFLFVLLRFSEGRYLVQLYINGAWRGVQVDDTFPVAGSSSSSVERGFRKDRLRCGFSLNVGEMWVSLIEKAVYKLFYNGYDHDGSFSCSLFFLFH